MGEAKLIIQTKVDETEFSFQDKQQPATHFLQTFSSSSSSSHQIDKQISQTSIDINIPYGPTEPDLNLRLSLGGIYNKENPLSRSSSIAGMLSVHREKLPSLALPRSFLSLERSCSLPAEVERSKKVEGNVNVNVKELRIMRRFEAKKRVVEKQKVNGKRSCEEEMLVVDGPPASPSKIPAWAAASAAKSPALNKAIEKIKEGFRKLEGLQNLGTPTSSSNSRPSLQPVKLEPLNTSETETNVEPIKLKPAAEIMSTNQTKKAKLSNSGCIIHNEIEVMKKMPSVTTTGEGPNGRKIEGFLYKYMKGQVIIVCVCHGNFLSAEEFVKHSGRKDVRNPTKHINICSTTFS